jgi:methionyl-tRNA formyltransferase
MTGRGPERIVILCTVEAGIDTLVELLRSGVRPAAIIGLHPNSADPDKVSGWVDVGAFGQRHGVRSLYVRSYALKDAADRAAIEALSPDLVLITGWQRLAPPWLLDMPRFGVLGGHGSPDGIHGGRGRSPQTWALLLGCRTFDLSLFRVTPGIDDGPVLATRTFAYAPLDDIRISYYRASLAMAEMIAEVIASPARLLSGEPQPEQGAHYPQRRPEDGWADWRLSADVLASHCRALTHPYPGLRTAEAGHGVRIWQCQRFDDEMSLAPGEIGPCFTTDEFLIGCLDGRLLVRMWSTDGGEWRPEPGKRLEGRDWNTQLKAIVDRHERGYPHFPIAERIQRQLDLPL